MKSVHIPVLLHEVIEQLIPEQIRNSNRVPWYVDGTLGGAGHAAAVCESLKGRVNVVGLDRDIAAIERAKQTLAGKAEKLVLELSNFRDMDKVLGMHGIELVDMILLDLGLSSDELDVSGRGFSFRNDEPLLMTMGDPKSYAFTAKDILNQWAEADIANVIYAYGEENFARRIAKAIVDYRTKKQFETTHELAEVVKSAVPSFYRHRKIHPATKTFQALRIAVNDELKAIEEGLSKGYGLLGKGGRMGVISFHSLEDRIVKAFMRSREGEGEGRGGKIITKKAVKPSDEEIAANPRARSAKLRIIEKIQN